MHVSVENVIKNQAKNVSSGYHKALHLLTTHDFT